MTKGSNRFLPCRAARGTHKSPVEPEGDGQTGPHSFGILAINLLPTPGCAARACTQLPRPSSVPQGARRGSPQVTATAHPRGPGPHKKTTSRGSPASQGLLFPAALIPPSQQHLEAASCPDPPSPGCCMELTHWLLALPTRRRWKAKRRRERTRGEDSPGPPKPRQTLPVSNQCSIVSRRRLWVGVGGVKIPKYATIRKKEKGSRGDCRALQRCDG